MEYVSDDGYTILVGRNNVQNDLLTFKTAAKDDETYKAMQTCVAEKQCPACKEHLKRIDDEKRQEQNRACTVGDGGDTESWWNCVVERNCEQCWNKLKENSEQNQKEQADKPKS